MAKESRPTRVAIGFVAGQVVTVRLTEKAYADLIKAVKGDTGWREIEAEDARVVIDTRKVAYVQLATEEHKVGFSGP